MPSILSNYPAFQCGSLTSQYMSSRSFIKVDWAKLSGGYDSLIGSTNGQAPTVGGVWTWFVDFVTANFQRKYFPPSLSSARRSVLTLQNGQASLLGWSSESDWVSACSPFSTRVPLVNTLVS
jgi:hypothetical protein